MDIADVGRMYFWVGCTIIPYWLASKLNSVADKISKAMIVCLLYSLALAFGGYVAFDFVLFDDLFITMTIAYIGILAIVIADRLVRQRKNLHFLDEDHS